MTATRCSWICSTWLRSSYLATGCPSSTPPFTPSSTRLSAATAPTAAVRIRTRGRRSRARNSARTKTLVLKIRIRREGTGTDGRSINYVKGRIRFATRRCSDRHRRRTARGVRVPFLVVSSTGCDKLWRPKVQNKRWLRIGEKKRFETSGGST